MHVAVLPTIDTEKWLKNYKKTARSDNKWLHIFFANFVKTKYKEQVFQYLLN